MMRRAARVAYWVVGLRISMMERVVEVVVVGGVVGERRDGWLYCWRIAARDFTWEVDTADPFLSCVDVGRVA